MILIPVTESKYLKSNLCTLLQKSHTMKITTLLPFLTCLLLLLSCNDTPNNDSHADLILTNGKIITLNEKQPEANAIAIQNGRITHIGTTADIQQLANGNTKKIDLKGSLAIPGLIEGHGHFSGLGYSLIRLNLMKTKNWDEIVAMVAEKVKKVKPGEWIDGRGWHQEKWNKPLERDVEGYPYHDELSAVSPDNPVLLRHASGHSAFANEKAMELAGITAETPSPKGGLIVRDVAGEAVGVFEERAMDALYIIYDEYRAQLNEDEQLAEWHKAVELAQKECLAKGITSFQDAGSSLEEIERYKKLAEDGKFDLRLWAMVRHPHEILKDEMQRFPVLDAGNGFFTSRSIKSQVDGALGARGAWLLEPYKDKPGFFGQNTTTIEEVTNMADLAIQNDMQLCIHAIGDRANREVLDVFEQTFQKYPNKKDLRWRIEHAQHVDVADIPRFAPLGVIASMQGIHCTSDAPFVEKRLGEDRARHEAYPWRSFIDSGALVTNGTDAPVEDVDPLESYYASVTRKRVDDGTEFFPEQSMTRIEALRSYTINCAFAAFEEKNKGSLEIGKYGDITVLSKDVLTVPDDEIMDTEILYTIVNGEVKYQK